VPNPPHLLASFRGVLGESPATGLETWSFGLRFAEENPSAPASPPPAGAPGASASQELAQEFAQAAGAFITGSANFTTSVWFTEVRLYDIGTDGKMVAPPFTASNGTPNVGTSSNHVPYQLSTVVSLYANGLGKGRRGRIYLPPQGFGVGRDGLLSQTHQNATGQAVGTFLNALINNTRLSTAARLVVIGKTGSVGTVRGVDHVLVGRVIDTQRRRRRSLDEARVDITTNYADYDLVG